MRPAHPAPLSPQMRPSTAAQPGMPALMRRLRAHTAATHQATEDLPLMRRVLDERPTVAGYRVYLAAFQGVYSAVEPALYAAVPASVVDELGIAPKLPALEQDLLAMAGALPDGPPPPPEAGQSGALRQLLDEAGPERCAAALGGLYVLEGATLGGQVIARRLRERWPAGTPLPSAFLEFRLTHPGHGWRGFGEALADWAARHPGSEDAILDGALGIFELMQRMLAEAEPASADAA